MGGLYWRLAKRAPVAGYSGLKREFSTRKRNWRSDGVESALGMAVALAYCSDIRTGFIGRPQASGGHWERFGIRALSQFAYGCVDDATLRRAERALFVLEKLGILRVVSEVRICNETGAFRSQNAIRRLNWNVFARFCGTDWLLKKDRMALDAKASSKKPSAELCTPLASPGETTVATVTTAPKKAAQPPRRIDRGGGIPQSVFDALKGT